MKEDSTFTRSTYKINYSSAYSQKLSFPLQIFIINGSIPATAMGHLMVFFLKHGTFKGKKSLL